MLRPPESSPARRALLALVALVLIAGLGLLLWVASAPEPGQEALEASPRAAAQPSFDEELAAELEAPPATADPASESASTEREELEDSAGALPGEGFQLYVRALAPDGTVWPSPWTLHIEDEREGAVRGWRPRAEPKRELAGIPTGDQAVAIDWLQPGKWAFHAEAKNEGGEHRSARVRGVFKGGPGAKTAARTYELELVLHPANVVEGRVLGAESEPLEGVLLALDHAPDASRHWARTDAQGWYAFTLAAHGEYRLSVGHPDHPTLPSRLIAFAGAQLVLEPIVLTGLGELRVRVLEPDGRASPGVRLRSQGSAGGSFEGETDAQGIFHARHLPAGRYRVFAELDPHRRANRVIELAAGASLELEIQLP